MMFRAQLLHWRLGRCMFRHFLTAATSFSGYFCIFLFGIGDTVGKQDITVINLLGLVSHASPQSLSFLLWSEFVLPRSILNIVEISQPLSRVMILKTDCCSQVVSLSPLSFVPES